MPVYWPDATAFDLILLMGQSNMNGAGETRNAGVDTSGGAYQFGQAPASTADDKRIVDAPEALQHDDNNPTGTRIGFCAAFAREFYIPARPERKLMWVPSAHGGTGFSDGYWTAGSGAGYLNAVARAKLALQSRWLGQNQLKAIFWSQGEDDTSGPDFSGSLSIPQYTAALDACLTGFRTDIPGAGNLPIFMLNMRTEWAILQLNGLDLMAAIADTPNRISNCYCFTPIGTEGNSVLDDFHYSGDDHRDIIAPAMWALFDANVPA